MTKISMTKLLFVLFIGSVFALSSCKEEQPKPEPNKHEDAYGDVFVKKVKTPMGDKYGLVFYAGGQGLTSCQAKAPDGTTFDLIDYWKGAGNMRFHPAGNQLKGSMPASGNYVLTLTFDDGETKEITDVLSSDEIPSIKGVNVTHVAGTEEVAITWNEVTGVDKYLVKLTDKYKNKKKPLFVQNALTSTNTSYTFNKTTTAAPGWLQGVPVAGDTCYVMVVAVKYEAGAQGATKDQNKQINTTKPTMIIW